MSKLLFICVIFVILTTIHCALPPTSVTDSPSTDHSDDSDESDETLPENSSEKIKDEIEDEEEKTDENDSEAVKGIIKKSIDVILKTSENYTDYGYETPVNETGNDSRGDEAVKVLVKWSKLMDTIVTTVYKETLPYFLRLEEEVELSPECSASLLAIASGLIKQQSWAFRFIDAFGRIPAGFIDGTITDFGEYHECLEIEIPREDVERQNVVVGKYCLLRAEFEMPKTDLNKMTFHEPVLKLKGTPLENSTISHFSKYFNAMYTLKGFRFGLCLPSTCSAKEIEELANNAFGPVVQLPLTIGPENECDTKNDVFVLTIYQKVSIAAFGVVSLIVVIATFSEVVANVRRDNQTAKEKRNTCLRVLQTFSALKNSKKLFRVAEEKSDLSAVHGIRVLSMLWLIIGHTYLFGAVYRMLYAFKRLQVDIPRYPGGIQYQALNNSYLCVDSFFFISGLVLIYVTIPLLQKAKGRFNYLAYIAHRWLRLTPAVVGLILFIYLFPFFGDGPVFKHHVSEYVRACELNWWNNVLFINNWQQNIYELCAEQTWFIAADFQIYVFAPLLFLTYIRSETSGMFLNIFVVIAGILSAGLSAYITESGATFTLDHIINEHYLHYQLTTAYLPTHQHVAPYGIGTLCGFLILKHRKNPKECKIATLLQVLLWLLLPTGSIFAMFYTYQWNDYMKSTQPTMTTVVIFAALQRTLWCLGIAWVTFACAVGKGGIINDFLSSKLFVPFSRLSFCVFLVHFSPILLRAFSVKYTRNWDDHSFLSWALMNALLSCVGAFVLYILFEAPFHNCEKLVFERKRSKELPVAHNAQSSFATSKLDFREANDSRPTIRL